MGGKAGYQNFWVVAHAVHVDSIDLANKDVMMEKICANNAASIPGLEIKWVEWLSSLAPGNKKSSLVVECKTAMQANGAIYEGLAIGAESHRCTMQHANRSNASNVNNTATVRLIAQIPRLAATALQVIRQRIVKKIPPKDVYCVQGRMRHGITDASIRRKSLNGSL